MKQFILDHSVSLALGGAAVFSICATALPDNLAEFDWRLYVPKVLKGLSQSVNKRPTPPA